MKKVLFSVVLALATTFGASAQLWIGGEVGFSSSTAKTDDFKATASTFSIAPEIGYSINDNLGVGLTFAFGTEGQKIGDADRESASAFAIAPFVQYKAIEFGKFQLFARAAFQFESNTGAYELGEELDDLWGDDKLKMSGFGVNIAPYMHYVINEKFNLVAKLNFLSLGFASVTPKYDGEKGITISTFNFGVDANNVANTGAFQLGFIYKF